MEQEEFPAEIIITYSKKKAVYGLLFVVLLAGLGWWLYSPNLKSPHPSFLTYFWIAWITVVCVVGLINVVRRLNDKTPRVTLDNLGIQVNIPKNDFALGKSAPEYYRWEEIGNEYVDERGEGRSTLFYLTFLCAHGEKAYPIGSLDTTPEELNYYLEVYRQRSGKKFYYQHTE